MIERRAFYPEVSANRAAARALDSAELVAFVIAVSLLVLVVGMWLRSTVAADTSTVMATITVQPGDTLWGLAEKYGDPDVYILERVDQLARANNIEKGRMLHEGQTLVIPVSSKTIDLQHGGVYASNQIAE